MPSFNGTGPQGFGPGTGRGLGPCGAGMARGFRGGGRGMGRKSPFFGNFGRRRWTQEEEKRMLEEEEKALQEELQETMKQEHEKQSNIIPFYKGLRIKESDIKHLTPDGDKHAS